MFKYNKNKLLVNENVQEFRYDIREVIEYKNNYVVLLSIPFDKNDLNNIYCVDTNANILWQTEDLNILFPTLKNLPYEQMGIKNDELYASDFYGRNYRIVLSNGKVEECSIVK